MPSIKALVLGIQKERPREFDAFCEIEKRLTSVEAGEGAGSSYCRVFNSGGLTIVTATPTILAFDSNRFDPASLHSTTSNTSRITIARNGMYNITANLEWPANAVGIRTIEILLNGATVIARVDTPGNAALINQMISTLYYLFSNDYIEIRVTQTSGGNLIIPANGNYSPEFSVLGG